MFIKSRNLLKKYFCTTVPTEYFDQLLIQCPDQPNFSIQFILGAVKNPMLQKYLHGVKKVLTAGSSQIAMIQVPEFIVIDYM